jgi:hypothetical protein
MYPVWYELNSYILFGRNLVFKGLNHSGIIAKPVTSCLFPQFNSSFLVCSGFKLSQLPQWRPASYLGSESQRQSHILHISSP